MKNEILTRLEQTAAAFGNKSAYSDINGSITFSEVEEKAKRIGSALTERIKPRSAVAVMMGRNVLTPVVFLGAIYAGCFYAPINTSMPESKLQNILTVLKPDILLVDDESMDAAKNKYRGGGSKYK